MEFDVTTSAQAVSVKWKDAATGAFTGKALVAALRRIGLQLQRTMMKRVSGDLLQVRTGNLRRALFYRIEESEKDREVLVRAGADLTKARYGRIHNFGGVIRPVRAQFLTIPQAPNLTGNGVMRVNAREFISNPGSIGFVGSFVNRKKTAILGVREDGQVEPVFALVKSVTIKPTGYMTGTLKAELPYVREQLGVVAEEITKELGNAGSN